MEAKILSVNCQGLRANEKRSDVFNYLKSKSCHIYCLQDTHFTKDVEKSIRAQWGNDCLFSFGTSNSRGVAILFAKNIEYIVHDHISGSDGNFVIADLTVETTRITLINIYGPNKDAPDFFSNILLLAGKYKNDKVIWCGDFNVVQNPNLDCYNYLHLNNKKAQEKVCEIKSHFNLIDPFRDNNPSLKRYTWRRKNPIKQARLDYFLITENLLSSSSTCKID